ncbi:MAG: cell wall metabolism sensor histidine kinase WalK [Chloroflexota bacterium]|nr:cell wall metabolism sensor histidine kinase WalK [Chloroflexota bacterium]
MTATAPAPARTVFGSINTRLLAAFVLVILVTLLSAGGAVLWLVQEYQRRLSVDRLSEVAVAASLLGRQLEVQGTRPAEIGDILAGQLVAPRAQPVRILLVDAQQRVLVERPAPPGETDEAFYGEKLDLPDPGTGAERPGRPLSFRSRALVWTHVAGSPPRLYTFITTPQLGGGANDTPSAFGEGRPDGPERGGFRRPFPVAYRVVLAIPERSLTAAWRELAPGLGLAALVSLPVSVAVALWLSRSITRPLRHMTQAADDMARGDLRQQIPVRGGDEVARLATSFNVMSREVERSQQALRDFLANASHELRTPLTSIQGFSQALGEGAVQDEEGAAEAGRIIHEEALRMRRLVEDLLYLSRVEARDVASTRRSVDVAGLLRETARRLQLTAEQRELRLVLDVPDLPPVLGDADELDHLFGNLLENAGKYTPQGGAITVTARAAGAKLVVVVHNTGTVIPAPDLPHVFERFYRVDKSRARTVEGSGLGLAIAQEVAHRHEGIIEVTSTPEQGTTFVITLPLPAVKSASREAKARDRQPAGAPQALPV